MRTVGLRIEQGRVSAAVVERRFGTARLAASFAGTWSGIEELASLLKERSREWGSAPVVASLPGARFSQRLLRFPFSDRKRLDKALPFELEDAVPFPLDRMVVEPLVLREGLKRGDRRETPVLGLLVPVAAVREHLDLLASAGIDPQAVVPSFAGLDAVARLMHGGGCTLFLAGTDLALYVDGEARALRSLAGSGADGGFQLTVQALEAEQGVRVEKMVLLQPDERARSLAEELGIVVEEAVPELGGVRAADPVSLGLALTVGLNVRKGELAYRRADQGARRRRMALAAAAAIAVLLFGTNLAVKWYVVGSGYGKLDSEIRGIYRQAFPGAADAADPLRMMRTKVDEAKARTGALGSGGSVLDVMKAVTDGVPKEVRVGFTEFSLEGDRLRLQGEAPSFESVDRVKAEFQKAALFAEVSVQDARMGVENRVKFRMELKLKQVL